MEYMCGFVQLSANQINIIIEFAYEIQSANSNLLDIIWCVLLSLSLSMRKRTLNNLIL